MIPTQTLTIASAGVNIHVRVIGEKTLPPLLALHGMLDVGASLLPIAQSLAHRYQVFLPDLRGHGKSDRPGLYSLATYLLDVHTLVQALMPSGAMIFGHSLGGQIATRFAALYPELVKKMVVVEGLGPPAKPLPTDSNNVYIEEGSGLLRVLLAERRSLPSLEFAQSRLLKNNPRLTHDRAARLVREVTETDANGVLWWAFDPRVASVFIGPENSEYYWPGVRCPTLLVMGAHCADYWTKTIQGDPNWTGTYAPGELESRTALFPNARCLVFDGSGHMVHFDEPERLAQVTLDFFAEEDSSPE